MDSLTFLSKMPKGDPPPILVVHGEETYLRRQVLTHIRQWVLPEGGDDFSLSTHAGDSVEWATVHGDLETRSFFGGRRLVIVENADPFISANRSRLEKYVGAPSESGVLVLEAKTWRSTTKLAKLINQKATLGCKAPTTAKLVEWAQHHCLRSYQKPINPQAARLLVELGGSEMGLLNQELAKLVAYVGEREKIETEDVDLLVGNNRAKKTFEIFELIGKGRTDDALAFLDRLLTQGEDAMRLLGAFGWQLRRLAQAARRSSEGTALTLAIREAGLYDINSANEQLRHFGFRRINKIYDWLLEVDLGLKGDSELSPRTLLERLIIRLARPNSPGQR